MSEISDHGPGQHCEFCRPLDDPDHELELLVIDAQVRAALEPDPDPEAA